MFVNMFKGKIHRATVTEAVNYVGSITIDRVLLNASGICPAKRSRLPISTRETVSRHTPWRAREQRHHVH
jgi:aspartate 1-decarboxylase